MKSARGKYWWPVAGLVILVILGGWGTGQGQEGQPASAPDSQAGEVRGQNPQTKRSQRVEESRTPDAGRNDSSASKKTANEDLADRVKRLEQQNILLLRYLRQQPPGPLPNFREGEPGTVTPPSGPYQPGGPGGGLGGEIREGAPGVAAPPEAGTPAAGPQGGVPPEAGLGGEMREGEPGSSAPSSGETPGNGLSGAAVTGRWVDVGRDFGMRGRFVNYQPWLESNDGAFRVHAGGRTQLDGVWSDAPNKVRFGKGGIGEFQDAVDFRRARLEIDGWMYEYFDFWCEYDFVNSANVNPGTPSTKSDVINTPVPTELWGSINFLPGLGTFRFGNQKNPLGLEHLISSRFLDFMERAPYFDTYLNRNNGMQPGLQLLNWTADERFTYQFGVFKNNQSIYSWNTGGGEYEVNARATWLPWYRDEGRYMMHLGFGVQYDEPENHDAILQYRWSLRNGPGSLHSTVALASIFGHHQTLFMPEFFMNLGSLSIMSEYTFNYLDQISQFQTQSQGTVTVPGGNKSYVSQAWYIQAMYFLTGEYRPYYRTALHHGGASPTRVVPIRNFFWLPGRGGFNPFSLGAWQVGARYAWSKLSDNGIFGGDVNEGTLGLNWFLNPNLKIQWNYVLGYRGNLGPSSTSNGIYQGVGTRLAFDF
jgi:phosphate-selective porin OprO/OprP